MDYRQALLEELGVSPSASPGDINDRYLAMAREAHPDAGGDVDRMSRINTARDTLLSAHGGTDMVPAAVIGELAFAQQRATALAERRADREEACRCTAAVVRHHVSPLVIRKRQAQAFSGIGAGATALTVLFNSIASNDKNFIFSVSQTMLAVAVALLGLLTAVTGFMAWLYAFRAQRLEMFVEDATSAMGDKGALYRLLSEIEELSGRNLPWGSVEVPSVISVWLANQHDEQQRAIHGAEPYGSGSSVADLARRVGGHDFAKLLLANSKAADVLEERVVGTDRGPRVSYAYKETTAAQDA